MSTGPEKIVERFAALGGVFHTPPTALLDKLKNIRGYIFDWDGVFNGGIKSGATGSGFSEADSMGTNLLRFGHWLTHGSLPFVAIITGEQNPAALQLAEREHFHAIYYRTRDKNSALHHLQKHFAVDARTLAFCYDDILDLPVAAQCGLRFRINRHGSPLFADYVNRNKLCDYQTHAEGSAHGVREVAELILGLTGQFDNVVDKRGEFEGEYSDYLQLRNSVQTLKFTAAENATDIIVV